MRENQTSTLNRLRSQALSDGVVAGVLGIAVYLAAAHFDVVNHVSAWFVSHEEWQIDELAVVAVYLVAASAVYIWRRRGELLDQIRERDRAEQEKEELIPALERALRDVQNLSSLLPVCAWCKRIRDDDGSWNQIDSYLRKHTSIGVTHGICPECAHRVQNQTPAG